MPGSIPTLEFPEKSCNISVSKPRQSADIINQKKFEHPIELPISSIIYNSFEEFNFRISNLKIAPWSIEYSSTYTKISKYDEIHSVEYLEVYVLQNFEFKLRCLLLNINFDHIIFAECGKSLQYITLSNLIHTLDKFFLCPGIENDMLLKASQNLNLSNHGSAILHNVPTIYDPTQDQIIPIQQSTFYRSKTCNMLVVTNEICTNCQKEQGKLLKAEKRKLSMQSMPAKAKAPISQTSVKRLQLTLSQFRFENEDLKSQIKLLQKELNSSSFKINDNLSQDFVNIYSNTDQEKIPDFMKLFWNEQQKYINAPSSKGIRYHPMIIRFCLALASKSPAAYEELRYDKKSNTGVLILPSRRRLRDYKNYIRPERGFNPLIIDELLKKVEDFSEIEKYMILVMDEMKIQENLVWDKNSGELIGYVDLGDVDVNYSALQKPNTLASHVLVFLLRSIVNRFKFSLANFATTSATSIHMFILVWKAISICEMNNIKILGLTCDGASANRKMIKMHSHMTKNNDKSRDVIYRVANICSMDKRFLYFISDAPHLVKTLRNCLLNSGFSSGKSRLMWNAGYDMLWKHIKDIYDDDRDCDLHLLPKLTSDHINLTSFSKMNVRLAAQVLSNTVSNVLKEFGPTDAVQTAMFCEYANKFFDCLNVRHKKGGDYSLNPFLKPYESVDDERFVWMENSFLDYLKKWKNAVDFRPGSFRLDDRSKMFISWQTYEGIKITVYSTIELTRYLLNNGVKYVLTGNYSQDCLENYNGRQRALGCRKDNPTLKDFGYNDNTIRNSKVFKPISGGNCESDDTFDIVDDKLPCRKTKRKR